MMLTKILFILSVIGFAGQTAHAETTEQRFHDILITAGYATAIGAGLGAASLSFYSHPEKHLKKVAVGASLGFISGTILGSYMVLSPVIASNDTSGELDLLAGTRPNGLHLRPIIDADMELKGAGIAASLAKF